MGSIITGLIVGIFDVIGKALAGAFLAELSLVQDFINNSHVVFGGNFANLLGFNAIVIPGLAMLVTLVWLAAKGLTGGNSKTSTEDIIKRVLGALVISLVLSLVVGPTESLIGALDSSLMSLVNVNSQGLQHTFATIATLSAIGGIEDSIFISVVILFLGLLVAGMLILILILAHAAVFLLVYFAPYFALFRKEGFREMTEGVVAALSMPFIITSILAVGIATMGATGTIHPAAAGAIDLGTQTVALMSYAATKTSTSISAVDYFANAIGGLLILGAAVFLPKFILGMVFQAGTAIHDAFRDGHKQLAGTAMNRAKDGLAHGKMGGFLHDKLGGGSAPKTKAPVETSSPIDKGALTDQAMLAGGATMASIASPSAISSSSPSTVASSATAAPNLVVSGSTIRPDLPGSPAPVAPSTSAPAPDLAVVAAAPAAEEGEQSASAVAPIEPGAPDQAPSVLDKKPIPTRIAHFTADHYKGTVRAIPATLSSLPPISAENPLESGVHARSAWRAAKRESIHQVRSERSVREGAPQQSRPQVEIEDDSPQHQSQPPIDDKNP